MAGQFIKVNLTCHFGVVIALCLILTIAATGQVRIEYDANNMREPDKAKLGFWWVKNGTVNFPNAAKGPLVTVDDETERPFKTCRKTR